MSEEREVWVQSGYGGNTKKPFVAFHYQDVVIQLDPEKAREIAMMLLESAEAAEQDAFMVEFAGEECGTTEQGAVSILAHYRGWRERRRGNAGNAI